MLSSVVVALGVVVIIDLAGFDFGLPFWTYPAAIVLGIVADFVHER